MNDTIDTEQKPSEEPATGRQARKPRKPRKLWQELPVLFLIAVVVAVLIKSFLFQPFWIPSRSMVPTLLVDDRVMVSKLSYRFGEISRGDVIVFSNPDAVEVDDPFFERVVRSVTGALGIHASGEKDLIKRVVAVGGDEFEIRDNQVRINGVPIDEPYLAPGSEMADMAARRIPEGTLWMMGDNRSESRDSRVFGPIPLEDVVGKAILRIWPPDRFGKL